MKFIGYITTTIIVIFLSAIFSGYVLSVLWGWFILPVFDAPTLTISSAIGLSIVVGFIARDYPEENNKGDSPSDILGKAILKAAIKPLMVLLVGWIVTLFM